MIRSSSSRSRRPISILAAFAIGAVGLLAAIVPSALAATTSKPYAVTVSPICATSTTGNAFTVGITNENQNSQSIGSVDLTSPFPVSNAVAVGSAGTTSTTTIAWETSSPYVIHLRNLNVVSRGGTLTLTVTADLSGVATGSYGWTVAAKQSNDFNGPPGNSFFLVAAHSSLTTAVDGCHLEFVAQPADAAVNATITSVSGNPNGSPVAVAAKDPSGNTITVASGSVSLSIETGAAGASLTPSTPSAPFVNGIATFSAPNAFSIGTVGTGYELRAHAAGFADGVSSSFDIGDVGCAPATPCSLGLQTSETDFGVTGTIKRTITTNGGANGGVIFGSVVGADSADAITCAGYTAHTQGTLVFTVTTGVRKAVTVQIPKAQVQADPNNGASFYQVCYSNDSGFTDRFGATVPPGGTGLLPDCTYDLAGAPTNMPCVYQRNKTRAGDMLVGFYAPPGDPKGRL
jgi:hypothetical protein